MRTDDILQELHGPDRTRLLERAEAKTYAKGEVLIHEGDQNAIIYIILDGEVSVRKGTSAGAQSELTSLGLGSIFGRCHSLVLPPQARRSSRQKMLKSYAWSTVTSTNWSEKTQRFLVAFTNRWP